MVEKKWGSYACTTHGFVVAVCQKAVSCLPQLQVDSIQLIENNSIPGIKRANSCATAPWPKKASSNPNIPQVVLVETPMLAEITRQDTQMNPGMLGENITSMGSR